MSICQSHKEIYKELFQGIDRNSCQYELKTACTKPPWYNGNDKSFFVMEPLERIPFISAIYSYNCFPSACISLMIIILCCNNVYH